MIFGQVLYAVLSFAIVEAGLFSNSNVLKLTGANFRTEVLENDNVTVVEFYVPGSADCKSAAPELKKSAQSLHGIVRVGAVDCENAANKDLCSHYKIETYPTIKVFQPEKKTDRDWKAVHVGEDITVKPHRVLEYSGAGDYRSINKYAVSKLRNYAATLEGDMSFLWLRANRVPRVVMLPGSKYKSKSIAPLLKVLSNEYFGKMRFAYVPRRADGAWNLLGIQAPEESTIVYLSDDKSPHVYKGDLTKSKVKAFLDEQYSLEMNRRKIEDVPLTAEDNEIAYGLEYVLEDQQTEKMLHVLATEKEYEDNWSAYNFYVNSAREKRHNSTLSEKGLGYTPLESTYITPPPMATQFTPPEPTPEPDLQEFPPFTKIYRGADAADIGDITDSEELEEAELDDPEAGNIVELEDYTDAMLDEIDIELAPDEIVAEGPEAVEEWKQSIREHVEKLKESRAKQEKRQEEIMQIRVEQHQREEQAKKEKRDKESSESPTPVQQLPPGITPKAVAHERAATHDDRKEADYLHDNALHNMDSVLHNCIRRDKMCILMSSAKGFVVPDVRLLLMARSRFEGRDQERLLFQFYVEEDDPSLIEMSEDLGISPYRGVRTSKDGTKGHTPGIAVFDYSKRRFAVFEPENGDFNVQDIYNFIVQFVLKKRQVKSKSLPKKYIYWITENDMEIIDRLGFAEDDKGEEEPEHEEL